MYHASYINQDIRPNTNFFSKATRIHRAFNQTHQQQLRSRKEVQLARFAQSICLNMALQRPRKARAPCPPRAPRQ